MSLPLDIDPEGVREPGSTEVIETQGLTKLTNIERELLALSLSQPFSKVSIAAAVRIQGHKLKADEKKRHAIRVSLIRAANRLAVRKLASVVKEDDGLLWVYADRDQITNAIRADRQAQINLRKELCEIPTLDTGRRKKGQKRNPFAIPKNATGHRLTGIKLIHGVKQLSQADYAEINKLFDYYNDDTLSKIIAIMDESNGEILGAEYSTRFNDLRKSAANLDKYDFAIDKSLRHYRKACFLTITTDPKKFNNLWEANRNFQTAWNRFVQLLTKRFGRRPKYITANEYTKNGKLHSHALIMLDYLMPHKELSKVWDRCGQGKIVWVYNVYRTNTKKGMEWRFDARKRPPRSKGISTGDYIKKYLKKSMLASTDKWDDQAAIQSMYWIMNKRFWSCSRSFLPDSKTDEELPECPEEHKFKFLAVLDEDSSLIDRMIYYRADGEGWWGPEAEPREGAA